MKKRAWSFKTIEQSDLRYFGNNGYEDDSSQHYRYDNLVANHKNVKNGDLVIITNREKVIGVSIVKKITSEPGIKLRNKCPHPGCNAKKLTPRKTLKPTWRCNNDHKFEEPLIVNEKIQQFTANYADNFIEISNISMAQLKENTPRYNVQSSIQEVDLEWIQKILYKKHEIDSVLAKNDADDNYERNSQDERILVKRAIKQRRGQKKFRNQLILSNPLCAVTGCEVVDILEAAHIDAYRNDSHNHIENGILLRSDIHTLYDLNLLAIHPLSLKVYFNSNIQDKYYQNYNGSELLISHKLSIEALNARWEIFNN